MADTRRVFQDARTFKGLSAALMFLPLTLFEEIDNKVRWGQRITDSFRDRLALCLPVFT